MGKFDVPDLIRDLYLNLRDPDKNQDERRGGPSHRIQINPHRVLYAPKPVSAQFRPAKPAGHYDDMPDTPFAFQHPQDDHPGPGFAVVVFKRAVGQKNGPGVMGCFGEFLAAQQRFDECLRLIR